MVVEELLQFLVREIDTQLFKTVELGTGKNELYISILI